MIFRDKKSFQQQNDSAFVYATQVKIADHSKIQSKRSHEPRVEKTYKPENAGIACEHKRMQLRLALLLKQRI